jgi:serpin B
MTTEDTLRSALTERAHSVEVGDPKVSVKQRIAARRHRRRRRLAISSAFIVIVVAAVALAPVLATSRHDRRTTASTRSAAPARPAVLASRLVRDTRPSVPASAMADLSNAGTSTAIELYHQLASTPGNVFFSPYSVATALTMAAAGARGATLSQMFAVLHNDLPAGTLHDATNALNLALLAPRTAPSPGSSGKPLELEIANSVWGQTGYRVEPGFLDLLAREYGAALNTLDFDRHAVGATRAINDWVDTHTNHKIKQLFDALDPATKLVLVNAVHFKASWLQPFLPAETRDGAFSTTTPGATVTVPFMHGTIRSEYAAGDGWQAVDVPYIGDASMTVIVPDAGRFAKFERTLDPAGLARIVGSLAPAEVTLALPKLQLKDQSDLIPALRALGMTDAFTNRADFSGITGNRDLRISQVVHQATVTVDEKGTEAAAATGLAFTDSALTSRINLTVDRPYLLLIRDHHTGTILFLGRVTDPTQTAVHQP